MASDKTATVRQSSLSVAKMIKSRCRDTLLTTFHFLKSTCYKQHCSSHTRRVKKTAENQLCW